MKYTTYNLLMGLKHNVDEIKLNEFHTLKNEDNEIEAIISSGEDITQQRIAEELLQKNDYLKRG